MIRQSQKFLTQLYALCDFIVIQFVFIIAWWIRFESGWLEFSSPLPIGTYWFWAIVYGAVAIVVGYLTAFYTPKRKRNFSYEMIKIVEVHVISLLVLLSLLFLNEQMDISRKFLVIYLITNIIFVGIYRFIVKRALQYFREKGYNKQFVLVLGAGKLGQHFVQNLKRRPELGYEILGYLDDAPLKEEDEYGYPVLGSLERLEETLEKKPVDEVIIALPLAAHHKYGRIIDTCEKAGVKAHIIPDYFDYLPAKPYFDNFAGIPLINVRDVPLDEMRNRIIKRAFDIVFSLAAIIITLPVMCLIAIGIKLTSPGPILFKQERVGQNRRTFYMYKFRTMHVSTDEEADTGWTVKDDPRRTAFGRFLRQTSLDELPQFFNVLQGTMSVVGPRPERPYYVEQFKEEVPKYMVKHHIRPGITGWAQSHGLRGDTSIEERIKYDVFYIENWSFLLDIKIIIKTIINGFINKNAY